MIVNDDIEVELTLYLENTLGKSDWETKTLDIIADAPPNADFTMLNTVYRNPLDSNNAVVNIHNISSSPDGDAIANLKGYYTYDSNNDGIFSEEKVKFYDGVNIDNLSFTSDKVGKYKVELEVRETYETLEGYEKQVPYLSDTTADKDLAECIIEIDNQAPTMDLTVINRIPVSIDFQLGNFDIDAEMLEDYISNNLVPTLESNGYELESYNIYEGKNAEAIESTADFSSIMDEQIDEDDQLHTVNIYNYKYFNEDYVLIDGYYTVDLYKIEGGELINITSLDGNYRAYSDGLIRESDKKGDTIGYYNIFGEEIEGSDELEGLEPQEKISDNISYDSIFVKSHKNEYDDRDVTKTYNEINRINIDSGSSINIRPYYLYRENVHWDSGSGTATTTDKTASVYKISENTELVFIKNTIDNAGHSTDRTFDSFKLFTFKNQIEENMKADRDYYVYLNNDENDILKIDEYRNKLVEVLMSNGLKFSTISQDADEIKEIAETTSGFNALTLDDFKRQLIENLDAEYKSDSSNEFKFLLDSAIVFDEMYLDYENDPRFQGRFKIDHVDPDYYENGLGVIESDGVYKILDDDSELKLDKTGKFILEPQVQDKPIDDVNFIDYYKWSEELVQNTIYVHRKPIADFEIEFYKDLLVTENNSYDIDHQSEFGKGIALSEWKHQKEDDYWIDGLPLDTEIEDMTDYTIALRVKDLEGAWSDWTVKEVNSGILEEKPIMLEGKLKTEESKFSVRSVPASEYLSIYNIKTEYKNDVSLEVYLENLYGEKIVNIKNLNFAEGVSGSQNIVDEMKVIDWNDIRYQIPPNLPDGNYNINIIAVNSLDTTKTTSLLLPFIVETPINLKSDLRQVKASEEKVITASSSLYTDSLELELFEGTDKSITLDMHEIASDESRKTWQVIYELGDFIDSGLYKGKFTGRTLNGNSESLVKDFELKSLEISEVEISGGWNHWRGQIDMFGAQLEENPLRFLSYEMMTIEVSIEGQVEEVTIRMSDELESMNYVDIYGNVINYRDELDYEVDFPVKMKEDKGKWTYKYVLPVAPSTLDWDDRRVENPYFVEIRAKSPEDENGESITLVKRIENIELTGNIYELIFLQPQ